MKRIIFILIILAWISPAISQVNRWGYGHGITFQIVTDTTSIDKTLGKLYFYTGDSTLYMGGGTYLNQAATFNELGVATTLTMTGSISGDLDFTDGTDTYTFAVSGDKLILKNDAGTPATLATFDSVGIGSFRGGVQIGNSTVADQQDKNLVISGDADADASQTTTESFTLSLEPNATPTSAYWKATTTQSGGYNFVGKMCVGTNVVASYPFQADGTEATYIGYIYNRHTTAGNGLLIRAGDSDSEYILTGTDYASNTRFYFMGGGKFYNSGIVGFGTPSPVANSLTLGTKAVQRDVIWTREATPAGTDSAGVLTIDDGNAKGYFRAGDADSLVVTCNNSYANLKSNNTIVVSVYNYFADTSIVNDSYGFLCADITAYTTGMVLYVKAGVANTAGCTLQINALGAKDIKTTGIDDPPNSYIEAGTVMQLIYDGTQFQLLSPDANP